MDGLNKNAYERRITRLEDEKQELLRKLGQSNQALQKFAHGSSLEDGGQAGPDNVNKATASSNESNNNGQEVRKLQDELNQLTKRNAGTYEEVICWSRVRGTKTVPNICGTEKKMFLSATFLCRGCGPLRKLDIVSEYCKS